MVERKARKQLGRDSRQLNQCSCWLYAFLFCMKMLYLFKIQHPAEPGPWLPLSSMVFPHHTVLQPPWASGSYKTQQEYSHFRTITLIFLLPCSAAQGMWCSLTLIRSLLTCCFNRVFTGICPIMFWFLSQFYFSSGIFSIGQYIMYVFYFPSTIKASWGQKL